MTEKTNKFDWSDFGERVLRAFVTGAATAIPTAASLKAAIGGTSVADDLWHYAVAVALAGLTSAFTAVKAGLAQGRGSVPADGSLK